MSEEVADEVQQTVLRMAAMLAGATDAAFLNECNKRLQVLERSESTTESHRSWLRWFPNAVDMTERTGRLTLWFIVVGLLAWPVVSNRLGSPNSSSSCGSAGTQPLGRTVQVVIAPYQAGRLGRCAAAGQRVGRG